MSQLVPYVYFARVLDTGDGDTFSVEVDQGLGSWRKPISIRLLGCNAREKNDPGGPEATAYLASLIPVGTRVLLRSVKYDKFGQRLDADVFLVDKKDNMLPFSLTERMIAAGYAAPWDGKGQVKPVPAWPISSKIV
jgi:endonuclease YncB( thermonuclease family)